MRVYQFRHIRAERQCSRTGSLLPVAFWHSVKRFVRKVVLFRSSMWD